MLPLSRLEALYEAVKYCETNHILGDYVECGVWKGGAMGLVALTNLQMNSTRRGLHLFDSFEEICKPDPILDGKKANKEASKFLKINGRVIDKDQPLTGIYDFMGGPGTLEENIKLLEHKIGYPENFIHYHKGWFNETLPADKDQIKSIAILRLDGDWYESTKVCLNNLFDKVVSGGVVIIDDYGTYDGCKLAVDEFIGERGLNVFLASVDRDCKYFIKS